MITSDGWAELDGMAWAAASLLGAVGPDRRGAAEASLLDPRRGGRGLRAWLAMIACGSRPAPDPLPDELIEIYLNDEEAEPLHDCGRCGLPVPVRVLRVGGHEAAVIRVYFPACPCCGGRTGRYAYWSQASEDTPS